MANIFTEKTFISRVNKMTLDLDCKEAERFKKGKTAGSKDRLELAFIRMITPLVSRKKLLEIDCYITKKY
jgi:hypothetical protein